MRLIARFPNNKQASFLVDSLRNIGFDRRDMIISDLAEIQEFRTVDNAAREISFIKTERQGFDEIETFSSGIEGLKGEKGIIVAVKTPKHEASRVREIMEQSGAVEIIQD